MASPDDTRTRPWPGPPLGPIVGSILTVIGWAIFILLYALYWSKSFDLFQDIIVTIVSLLIVGLVIALFWVIWGFSRGWRAWRYG